MELVGGKIQRTGPRCESCEFFFRPATPRMSGLSDEQGYCRRYPPNLNLIGAPTGVPGQVAIQKMSDFPIVVLDWRCGEFRQIEIPAVMP